MDNLTLNTEALRKLDFPINVFHGSVEHLDVKIPWLALESQPVQVLPPLGLCPYESSLTTSPAKRLTYGMGMWPCGWQVNIRGVYLLVGPYANEDLTPEAARKRAQEERTNKLDNEDKKV